LKEMISNISTLCRYGFILKGIESYLAEDSSHSLPVHGFILKGIESVLSYALTLPTINGRFHPQRN